MKRVLAVLLSVMLVMIATAVSGQVRIDPNGRPSGYDSTGQVALWIWYDGGGVWRVRATTKKGYHTYSGWVQFRQGLLGLGREALEGNVDIVSRFGDRVGFRLVATGKGDLDGFNLRTLPGTPVTFYVEIDGRSGGKIQDKIFVGRRNRSPDSNPFTLNP
ncbi:MAG TPA: hypothetical protein VJA65_05485 [bacterium]|nr:hypothetical protein [bacterium]